jgi:ribosome-associated toxin RatA of RatAB toxin-antitoxin module
MPTAKASVTINAPIERIFDVVADSEKATQYSPISEVTNIKGKPGEIGSSADYSYHVLGMKFTEHETVIEVQKHRKLVTRMAGGIPGTFEWALEPQDQATKVDIKMDYTVPGGILGKIADQLPLERINQKNLESMAQGLKIFCEA